MVFLSMLLFVVVRGLAEAEPFDLLLPLWSIVLVSLLVEHASMMDDRTTAHLSARRFGPASAPQPLPSLE
jgi:exopolysaccharide production protein ExoQ